MMRYWLTEDEQQRRDHAAEIGVEVNELEVAEAVAHTLTADLHDPVPLSYDMLEDAYGTAMIANHNVEPTQLLVSPRVFAEIKRIYTVAQRFMVSQPNALKGLAFGGSVIIASNIIADDAIGWRGINGYGILRLR